MEYCKYCKERKAIIEVAEGMETCPHSPNGRHYFVEPNRNYDAGYNVGYKMLRTFFSKPKNAWGIIWRVAVVLIILALFISAN